MTPVDDGPGDDTTTSTCDAVMPANDYGRRRGDRLGTAISYVLPLSAPIGADLCELWEYLRKLCDVSMMSSSSTTRVPAPSSSTR